MADKGTRYDAELKERALKLAKEIGVKKAAEQCGISPVTISNWRYKENKKLKEKNEKKLSKVIKPINPQEEIKDNPMISFQAAEEEERNYKRGEIYYVIKGITTGAEIASGRPAVIVSNDRLNEKTKTLEVVFLTTQVREFAPERVIIKSSGCTATALCQQISTVDKSRFAEYIGTCTPEEMTKLEEGIMHSFGLEKYMSKLMSDDEIVYRMNSIKSERDVYKNLYNELFERLIKKK